MNEDWYILVNGTAVPFGTFGLTITGHAGAGMPPSNVIMTPYPTQAGAQVQRVKMGMRALTLAGVIVGTSPSHLHRQRQALVEQLLPRSVTTPRSVTLRYTGASVPLTTEAYYHGGLDSQWTVSGRDEVAIQFLCPSPFWSAGTTGVSLAGSATIAPASTLVRHTETTGIWDAPLAGTITAIAPYRDGIVAGGTAVLRLGTAGVTTLGTITTPSSRYVTAIAAEPNGTAFTISGDFTAINGVSASRIARYTGAGWAALGNGLNQPADAVLWSHNGVLYVGGSFQIATSGGGSARHVASWNGAAWSAVGTFPNGPIHAMHWMQGALYVAGSFSAIGAVTAHHIARWDGTVWSALGPGLDAPAFALASDYQGNLYVGGTFMITRGGSVFINHAAIWNGAAWRPLGRGLDHTNGNGVIQSLWRDAAGGVLAAGQFNTHRINYARERITAGPVQLWASGNWFDVAIKPDVDRLRQVSTDAQGNLYLVADTPMASATVNGATTVTNTGSAATAPVFTVRGPGRLFQIRNITSGATLHFDLAVAFGETVTIDLRAKTVTSDIAGNRASAIGVGSVFSTFALLPGANVLAVLLVQTGDSAPEITVAWETVYWSVDV